MVRLRCAAIHAVSQFSQEEEEDTWVTPWRRFAILDVLNEISRLGKAIQDWNVLPNSRLKLTSRLGRALVPRALPAASRSLSGGVGRIEAWLPVLLRWTTRNS